MPDIYLVISRNFNDPYSIAMDVRWTFAEALKTMLSIDKDFVMLIKSSDESEDKMKALVSFNQQFLAAEKDSG